ncbi:MAG: signal peptidase I [Candidatus Omnitrophota bacterium]
MMVLLILVDGYKCTRAFNKKHFLERKIGGTKKFFLIIGIILASLGLNTGVPVGLIVRTFFAQAFKIPSGNMRMTLIEGDRLFANKLTYRHKDPERGDIAVFVYPVDKSRFFIKRVIAKGGEYVEIRDGGIYINDVLIELPSIKRNYYYNSGEYGQSGKKIKVPDNHYFVLGDNSQSSHDSRYWGFIPRKNFIGKAYKIYYPFSRSGPIDK